MRRRKPKPIATYVRPEKHTVPEHEEMRDCIADVERCTLSATSCDGSIDLTLGDLNISLSPKLVSWLVGNLAIMSAAACELEKLDDSDHSHMTRSYGLYGVLSKCLGPHSFPLQEEQDGKAQA